MPRRWKKVLTLAGVLAASMMLPLGVAQDSPAQPTPGWLAEYGYQPQDVAEFEFGTPGRPLVPIVSAQIQGERLPLIFDTGTNGYASLDSDVIARLRLPVKSWSTWRDSSGKPVARIPVAVAPSLRFGPIHLSDAEITGMGPESIMGKRNGYTGTLGWWSLRGYRVTLDYTSRKIALSRSPLPATLHSCATRYVTPFASPTDLDGLVLVEGQIAGKPIYVEVDTGKSSTELDPRIQALRQFKEEKAGYLIDGITIGPFEVRSRFGRMFDGFAGFDRGLDKPVYLSVGSDFLKDFLVTIDYPRRQVILEQKPCATSVTPAPAQPPPKWGRMHAAFGAPSQPTLTK